MQRAIRDDSDGPEGPARTFLVVDDMPIVRAVARAYLEEVGFSVVEAGDGVAALACCGTAMPDAILLDREMPHMDGERFLAALRLRPGGVEPTVLLCTSSRLANPESHARGVGADGFVDKPFDRAHLMSKLRHAGLLAGERGA